MFQSFATWGAIKTDLLGRMLPRRRALERLRARWGRPGSNARLFVERHFELTRGGLAHGCVDDTTWDDLEWPRVFAHMDATVSPIGSQVLYSRLRTYPDPAGDLSGRFDAYAAIGANPRLRERVQLILSTLAGEDFLGLADVLFGAPPAPPRRGWLMWLWAVASLVVLGNAVAGAVPVWAAFGVVCVNAVVVLRVARRMRRDAEHVANGVRLLQAADRLGSLAASAPAMPQLAALAAGRAERARARRALRWMFRLKQPPIDWIAVWLTLAFLAEPLAYLASMRGFRRVQGVLAATFEQVGSLDADVAVASWLACQGEHCRPDLVETPRIDLRDGYHPLIDVPVKNSLQLHRRSALIVGSNMAGKTTFIKMVGLNVIMAQTLGVCLASRASVPRTRVLASIRNEHSVASGKSHYLAEMDTIRRFVAGSHAGSWPLYLIDELFRGTNTIERIAAARAVLETLGEHAQVLVTTHDVELQAMLAARYDLYHFREAPEVEGFFDYRLRPGRATERNAIRLLGRMDFPSELVARAMAYAAESDAAPALRMAEEPRG